MQLALQDETSSLNTLCKDHGVAGKGGNTEAGTDDSFQGGALVEVDISDMQANEDSGTQEPTDYLEYAMYAIGIVIVFGIVWVFHKWLVKRNETAKLKEETALSKADNEDSIELGRMSNTTGEGQRSAQGQNEPTPELAIISTPSKQARPLEAEDELSKSQLASFSGEVPRSNGETAAIASLTAEEIALFSGDSQGESTAAVVGIDAPGEDAGETMGTTSVEVSGNTAERQEGEDALQGTMDDEDLNELMAI